MTRIPLISLTALVFVSASTAADCPSALATAKATKRTRTAVIHVDRPAVIVFAPPQWERDAKSDEGTREMVAHVRFAVGDVNRCKGAARIAVRMVFADHLALTGDGRDRDIDLSSRFPDSAGAFLFKPGKEPCSLATPRETDFLGDTLSQAVGEFFGVRACLQEGWSGPVCHGGAG